MCGSANEVKLCTCDGKEGTFCPLYPYRFGRRPGTKKRVLTDEQKKALVERMQKGKERASNSPI